MLEMEFLSFLKWLYDHYKGAFDNITTLTIYCLLNLELAKVQTGEISDISFSGDKFISKYFESNLLKFLFLKNQVIFSRKLLFELSGKG